MKFKNEGTDTLILGGYTEHSGYPLTIQPGQVVEADPERLKKLYTPDDLKWLRPANAPAIKPVVFTSTPAPEEKPAPAVFTAAEGDAASLAAFLSASPKSE